MRRVSPGGAASSTVLSWVGLSWADALGRVGGIVAAAAYVLVARGRVAPDSARFHAANAGAAALLAVAALSRDALPSAVLNLVWILFGGLSLVAELRRRPGLAARQPGAGGSGLTTTGR